MVSMAQLVNCGLQLREGAPELFISESNSVRTPGTPRLEEYLSNYSVINGLIRPQRDLGL